jgi:hypothetical protein
MADFEDIILRFSADDDEGKEALTEFAALLAAVGQEDANPEIDVKGLGKAELDLGKLVALLKAVDDTKAEPVIRAKTDEGRRAISLFNEALREMERFDVDIRPEVDLEPLREAQTEVTKLERKLKRQKRALQDFMGSDKATTEGGKIRAGRIRKTQAELNDAIALLAELKAKAESDFEVQMSTIQARANLDLLRRHLNELEKLVVRPEVRLDEAQAQRSASRIRAILLEITRLKGTAEVDIHTEAFQRRMADIRQELRSLQAEVVRPQIDLEGGPEAASTITQVTGLLELLGAMEADPEIDVEGAAAALGDIGAVAVALRALEDRSVSVDIHVKGRVERLGGILGAIRHGFGEAQEAAAGFAGAIGRVSVSFGAFTARLGPALILVLVVIGGYIVALIGGLVALGSSAILAAGGVAALATAFAAMLGPAALIAIAVLSRFAAILQALQARQQARLQKQQEAIGGNQQEVASLRAIADAARNLDQAQEALAQATVDANREMQDSYESVTDAVRALEHAELDRDRAKLGTERARLNLKQLREELRLTGTDISDMFKKFTDVDIRFDPQRVAGLLKSTGLDAEDQLRVKDAILDVREAKLREKDATDGLSDAERNLARAREDNLEFQQKGIRASQQYVAALKAVEDAERNLARARQDKEMLSAQQKAIALTEELSKKERTVLRLIEKIRDAFREGMAPVIDPIWDALIDVLRQVPRALRGIAPGMEALGKAVGGMIRAIGRELFRPGNLKLFNEFAKGAARLSGPVTRGLIALFRLFMEIAKAAMPALIELAGKFADQLEEWAEWAGEGDNMERVIELLVEHLERWLEVAYQLARVFVGFLIAAEGPGGRLAESLANSLRNLADFLATKEGRREMIDFFRDGAKTLERTAGALKDLVTFLGLMSDLMAGPMLVVQGFFRGLRIGASNITEAFEIAKGNIDVIFQAWNRGLGRMPEKVITIMEEIFKIILGWVEVMFRLGGQLASSIFEGMKSQFEELKPSFKKMLNSALNLPFLKFFKIGSPSKVFVGYGEDIVDGLFLGLKQRAGTLSKAVDLSLVPPIMNLPKPSLAAVAGAGGNGLTQLHQENRFDIHTPAGYAPDAENLVSQIDRKLRNLGMGA